MILLDSIDQIKSFLRACGYKPSSAQIVDGFYRYFDNNEIDDTLDESMSVSDMYKLFKELRNNANERINYLIVAKVSMIPFMEFLKIQLKSGKL